MEISEIKNYVSNELEKSKKSFKDILNYYLQSNDNKNDLGLVQFYNGMIAAYFNVLKTIENSSKTY